MPHPVQHEVGRAAGLVKFDFLGLKTLTVIEKAVELVRKRRIEIDLAACRSTTADLRDARQGRCRRRVPARRRGMRDILTQLKPDRFEDMMAHVALYPAGPDGQHPDLHQPQARRASAATTCIRRLEPILKETYGVIIYQEQVMQIAQVLGGYSLGDADILRRAMGKKIKAEMAQQQAEFVEGAVKKGVEPRRGRLHLRADGQIRRLRLQQVARGGYALIAYQTAYLKANYPIEFLAASMTLDIGNADKLSGFAQEARRLGMTSSRPRSTPRRWTSARSRKRDPLFARGAEECRPPGRREHLTRSGAPRTLQATSRTSPARINPRLINKRALETLAAAGAFDELGSTAPRPSPMSIASWPPATVPGDAAEGQAISSPAPTRRRRSTCAATLGADRPLSREFEAVGFFLTGHPLDDYRRRARSARRRDVGRVRRQGAPPPRRRHARRHRASPSGERKGKTGNPYAFVAFSDPIGQFEAVVFSERLWHPGLCLSPAPPLA